MLLDVHLNSCLQWTRSLAPSDPGSALFILIHVTESIWKRRNKAADFLCRDWSLWQKDNHLCSAHQSGLYGRVTRQKSLWSKKHMTGCREFAKWPLQACESMKEKFFWYDERKTELLCLTATDCSWQSDQTRLSRRAGLHDLIPTMERGKKNKKVKSVWAPLTKIICEKSEYHLGSRTVTQRQRWGHVQVKSL